MPVIEAMSCGLPVIVTGGGATDSFVKAEAGWKISSRGHILGGQIGQIELVSRGWLLEPGKAHLAGIMKYASQNPAECRQRGAYGRAIVERAYDWNDIAMTISERLKELAERVPALTVPNEPVTANSRPAAAQVGQLELSCGIVPAEKFSGGLGGCRGCDQPASVPSAGVFAAGGNRHLRR